MVRMVLVGIPGVALYIVGIAALLLGAMPHSEGIWALGGVAAIAAGLPMALYGMGAWGRWLYLWAFVVLPFVFAATFVPLLLMVPPGERSVKIAALLAFAVACGAAFVVMRLARATYARRAAARRG